MERQSQRSHHSNSSAEAGHDLEQGRALPGSEATEAPSPPQASEAARKLSLAIAAAALERKATSVEFIDVSGKVDYADMLVLMSGRSERHVHAIAKGLQNDLREELAVVPLSVEGLTTSHWVLLDYNDVVVHVFEEDARCFYDLEGLWIDAGRVAIPNPPERENN